MNPTTHDIATRLARLPRDKKQGFLQILKKEGIDFSRLPIVPVDRSGLLPVSYAQLRQWFLWKLDPASDAYHVPAAIALTGVLDLDALRSAFDALVRRHESLRTVFWFDDEGNVEQEVVPAAGVDVALIDLRAVAAADRDGRVREEAQRLARMPFDLGTGPLWRVGVIRCADDEHVLVVVMHHIVSDAWSMQVIVREFAALYRARVDDRQVSLEPLPIRYADYAIWQRDWLEAGERERQLAYWVRELGPELPVLTLPTDHPRRPDGRYRAAVHGVKLSETLVRGVHERARAQGATAFTVLLAGFGLLLHRYTGQEDIRVGVPIANRHRPETQGVVGFFVNTQVLRGVVRGDLTLDQVLTQVKEAALGAQAHQDLPFEQLVEALQPERSVSANPLFQVMFNYVQGGAREPEPLPGLTFKPYALGEHAAQFELSLDVVDRGDGTLRAAFTYPVELFDASTIEWMASHYLAALEAFAFHPEEVVRAVRLHKDYEWQRLLRFGTNDTTYPDAEPVHRLIERRANERPTAAALVFGDASLTCDELNARANRLAHRLIGLGVGPETTVGIAVERSIEMVVGLLAILKAGGAYVPLDPEYPADRLDYMVTDSGIRLLLTQRHIQPRLPAGDGLQVLTLDALDLSGEPSTNPGVAVHGDTLAYVIYTSGSTGKPKGAANRHRSLANKLLWMQEAYALGDADAVLQKTPFSFDVSVWEFFWPLISGARLVMARPGDHRDPGRLVDLIRTHGVTTVHFVPSMLQAFAAYEGIDACDSLTRIVCSGEALSAELQNEILARLPHVGLFNLYGPTEAAIEVTHWTCRADGRTRVPIGQPIADTQTYVLDDTLNLTPQGVAGELCLGGISLARGYLHRPGLTVERFVANPFDEAGGRLYRTGDLVRWRADGQLEYLGRLDHQIKIRGFRVELGEIESQLLAQPGLREAVVVAKDAPQGARLVAYVSARAEDAFEPAALRDQLARVLPDYMVPSTIVALEALPLTPSGKIDRKALPEPEWGGASSYEPPHGEVEEQLAEIWSEVLGVARVGRHDNFFELGGDSIVSLKVLARARKRGLALSPWHVFEHQTLAASARAIETAIETEKEGEPLATPTPFIPDAGRGGPLPLSFAQGRQWFLWQLDPTSTAYHISTALDLRGPLDMEALQGSFDALVRRHESLRTSFRLNADGVVEQHVQPDARPDVRLVDLTSVDERERRARALEEARRIADQPFDLTTGPLLRVGVIRVAPQEHVLLVVMHHIVSDEWSTRILVHEFAAWYRAARRGGDAALPTLPIQYADYAVWQRRWLEAGEGARQLAYWKEQLGGEQPVLGLAADHARRADARYRAARHSLTVSPELALALHEMARPRGATLFMALLTAFQVLLNRYTGQDDVRIGSPFANRHRPGTEGLVGYFINTLVLRGVVHGRMSLAHALTQSREAVLAAQKNQDLPLDHVVEALQPERGVSSTPLFQVVFNHLGTHYTAPEQLEDVAIASFAVSEQDAKLDLTLITSEQADGTIRVNFDYAADLFNPSTIERMAHHYLAVLTGLAWRPEQAIGDVALLDAADVARLNAWGTGVQASRPPECVTRLIDEQIEERPRAIAVVSDEGELSYEALDRRAGALARRLIARGVRAETTVGIVAGRTTEFVVGLLAVLRAGGAFVPLDPALPAHRLAWIVRDSGAALVLSAGELAWDPGVPVLSVSSAGIETSETGEPSETRQTSNETPAEAAAIAPEQAAYVIYTSGSTGQPKGVVISHASLASYVRSAIERLQLTPDVESMAMVSTVAADLGHTVLFGALCAGRALHLVSAERAFDPDRFAEYLRAHRVDVVKITPSHVQALLNARAPRDVLPRKRLVLGGEATPWSLLDRIAALSPDLRVLNHYGPTETTVGMLTQDAASADRRAGTLPVGRPLGHGTAYVLDESLNLVPRGVAGELFLGGRGVGRGYLQRAALTAQRFVADPFGRPGERLYRTGDLVRWTDEGQLEFLGRVDQQVKIRGFRVEPGEVEAELRAHADVNEAVVVAGDGPSGARLIGYVSPHTGRTIDVEGLRRQLSATLPEYMVPAAIVALPALPLNANGKVDRKALPRPDGSDGIIGAGERAYEAPRGHTEELLAKIWCEVLGTPRVGRHDRFFQLGGDSIVSVRVVSRLRKAGLSVTVRQMFEHQTIGELARVAVPVTKKARGEPAGAARETLRDYLTPEAIASLPFTAEEVEDVYPLTPTQEGMFFHSNEVPGAGLYVNQLSVEVSQVVPARFARAWHAMVDRHAILRTGILWQDRVARPVQIVFTRAEAVVVQLDWRGVEDVPARLAAYLKDDLAKETDWLRPPLARVALIRIDEEKFQLVWTHHHILFDGWSASRLMGEWLRHYAGETLPAAPPVFGSYVRWLRKQDVGAAERFWKTELSVLDGPTLLTEAVRRNPGTAGFAKIYSHFDRAFTDRLKEVARSERVTVNTVIQAAWTLILQHYTSRDHVVFGATVAGRPERLPGAEDMIGLFINTIPVPASRQPGRTVGEYLRALQERALRLRDYEHSALADIQRWAGSAGRPLFDSIIVFENTPVDQAMRELDGYGMTFGRIGSEGLTGYAMDLQVVAGNTVAIEYCYSRTAFEDDLAADIRRRMEQVLSQMVADPERRVGELRWLDDRELNVVLARGQGESLVASEAGRTVHQLIEEHARRGGEAIALVQGDEELTYAQLDRRANRLARHLLELGMGAETLIGVALERSLDSIVTMLAVLKAGAAYVPLDPAYPTDRLLFMLTDSRMSLLLMHRSLRPRFPETLPTPVVMLESLDLSDVSEDALDVAVHPEGLAYVIYTSGSTGTPKGVAVSHGPLARHCLATARIYGIGPQSRELHFMSFAFDGAHERWLAPLCVGARLALRDDELWTAEKTYEALHRYRVTNAAFPPAYLEQIADWAKSRDDVPPVELYVFGGEAMPKAAYDKVRAALRPRTLINGYGPTETVITPLIWKTDAEHTFDSPYAPIGRPVGARSVYVLDADMQPVLEGVCGELYVGGDGLARGYLGRQQLTAERFVANPFVADGDRLYRTGDLVRWMSDGNIEYVGRTDHQVKVRGFRIELGEIEARIREVPGVLEVAVVPHQRATVQLAAYVVPTPGESPDALMSAVKERLEDRLPSYMVPARIISLSSLPRLVNGKLDRAALPEPVAESVRAFVAPRNETERRMAEIWKEILGCEQVGITDNFFELGGDSILSLQVISRVRNARLGFELRLRDLLRYQTIDALMASRAEAAAAAPEVPSVAAEGNLPLIPIQEWFFAEPVPDRHHFNQSVLLKSTTALDEGRLRAAIVALEQRHDGLRMRFRRVGAVWEQRYEAAVGDVLWVEDVGDAKAIAEIGERAQRSLSLEDGPVWRAVYMRHADGTARLLIVIHHLVVDGVSWRVLLQDLQELYQSADSQSVGYQKSASYKAWALHLAQWAKSRELASELPYWLAQVEGISDIPRDNQTDVLKNRDRVTVPLRLDRERTQRLLRDAQHAYKTGIDDLLLAALARTIAAWTENDDVLVNLEGHGREGDAANLDLSQTIGWFTTMYPVRLGGGRRSVEESIRAAADALRSVPNKGVGHGVLRYLHEDERVRTSLGAVRPRITFNYLGQFDQTFKEGSAFAPATEFAGYQRSLDGPMANWLEIVGDVYDGTLTLRWIYNSAMYQADTIARLTEVYREQLEAIIDHCVATHARPAR